MAYQDFREFLDVLRRHGELIDIDRPVALSDVGKALKRSNMRQGPALMFKQNGTEFPLVGGVYSTRSKALLAFETTNDNIFDKVVAGLSRRLAPTIVSGQALCQEHVITGDAIDIRRFPVPVYSPKDGGAYITRHRRVEGSRERRDRYRPLPLHGARRQIDVLPHRTASSPGQESRQA